MTTRPQTLVGQLDALGVPEELRARVAGLSEAVLGSGPLPAQVVHLALALTFTNKGRDEQARRHGRIAVEEGLTRAQAVEALLAGVLSRGFAILWHNLWLVEEAPGNAWPPAAADAPSDTGAILSYFEDTFGGIPPWLDYLATWSPETLEAYYGLRAHVLRDGAFAHKHKELILVVINAAERYDVGMEVHMKGALAAGATRDELMHAVRVSIAAGGMVAWLEAAGVVERVLAAS